MREPDSPPDALDEIGRVDSDEFVVDYVGGSSLQPCDLPESPCGMLRLPSSDDSESGSLVDEPPSPAAPPRMVSSSTSSVPYDSVSNMVSSNLSTVPSTHTMDADTTLFAPPYQHYPMCLPPPQPRYLYPPPQMMRAPVGMEMGPPPPPSPHMFMMRNGGGDHRMMYVSPERHFYPQQPMRSPRMMFPGAPNQIYAHQLSSPPQHLPRHAILQAHPPSGQYVLPYVRHNIQRYPRHVLNSDMNMLICLQNPNAAPVPICGHCRKDGAEKDRLILCAGGCQFFFHKSCSGLTEDAIDLIINNPYAEWICDKCAIENTIPPVAFVKDLWKRRK